MVKIGDFHFLRMRNRKSDVRENEEHTLKNRCDDQVFTKIVYKFDSKSQRTLNLYLSPIRTPFYRWQGEVPTRPFCKIVWSLGSRSDVGFAYTGRSHLPNKSMIPVLSRQ